jgi:signal transduction histidine kinase
VLANSGLIEDLRASRQRLVTAQDEARRRLERNLHDGAQQDLVALGIKLQLADMTVENPAQTRQILGELKADAAGALANLRDLARGILPAAAGRPGAGRRAARPGAKSPLPVDGRGRRDRPVRPGHRGGRVLLLPGGAAKHRQIRPRHPGPHLPAGAERALRFTVSDDGTGYDARHTPMGSGLRNMADRLAALGGRLDVQSAPGQGNHHHRAPSRGAVTSADG